MPNDLNISLISEISEEKKCWPQSHASDNETEIPHKTLIHTDAVEFVDVEFPSIKMDRFRVKLYHTSQGDTVWIESNSQKFQWQILIADTADYGPQGVPTEAVISLLKVVMKDLKIGGGDAGYIDADISEEFFTLVLTLKFMDVWEPTYTFQLTRLAITETEELRSLLRDAQSEILKQKEIIAMLLDERENATVPFLSITSSEQLGSDKRVIWDGIETKNSEYFSLADSQSCILVHKTGLYQIGLNLGLRQSSQQPQNKIGITVEENTGVCTQRAYYLAGGVRGDNVRTLNVSEVLVINQSSKCSVLYLGELNGSGSELMTTMNAMNRFTLTYLGKHKA